MPLTIESTEATLGAIITDVDLSNLDDATWMEIAAAFHEYGVLILPGQNLSAEDQVAFGARFGEIEELAADHKIVPISNKAEGGGTIDEGTHRSEVLRGNEGWHTDSSYMPLAAKASVLSAHVVPSEGGQTEWADPRDAYDALDDATKEKIADLAAYHSLFHSQAKIGHEAKVGAGYGFFDGDPPLRSLVKEHPETGRKCLYIGAMPFRIPGLSDEDSETLLSALMDLTCQPPRTYMHDWKPGDIAVWDNRCVLHRARPYDRSEERVMMHTRIKGDLATETALAVS